jgi:hypothetical protein
MRKYFPDLGAEKIPVVLMAFPKFNFNKSNGIAALRVE